MPIPVPTPLAVVVGNPKAKSRTLAVAEAVGSAAADASGFGPDVERVTIDLADYADALFDWSSVPVRGLVDAVSGASLAIFASPTYKATYSGLLKAFLDWFSQTSLSEVTAVPVMVGAEPTHALAVEVHLRPLLVEIGATVPTRGLYVTEDKLDQLPAIISEWLVAAAPRLRASATRPPGTHPRSL